MLIRALGGNSGFCCSSRSGGGLRSARGYGARVQRWLPGLGWEAPNSTLQSFKAPGSAHVGDTGPPTAFHQSQSASMCFDSTLEFAYKLCMRGVA